MIQWGRNPGLVVKGGDSCPRDCEFESQCRILVGSFFKFLRCAKIVLIEWPKKRGCEWPIFLLQLTVDEASIGAWFGPKHFSDSGIVGF